MLKRDMYLLVVATLVSGFSVFAMGLQATPANVCYGPTWNIYEYPNCSGTYMRQEVLEHGLCPGHCGGVQHSAFSANYTCGPTRVAMNAFSQGYCQGPSMYTTTATQECINYRGISAALLCNPLDPVYPPHSNEQPTRGDGDLQPSAACVAPFTCTPNVPFITYYRDHRCLTAPFSSWEISAGAKLDHCYYDSPQRLNVKFDCPSSRHLVRRAYAHGCQRSEFSLSSFPCNTCFLNGNSGYGMIYSCGSSPSLLSKLQSAYRSLPAEEILSLQAFADEAFAKHGHILANPFDHFHLP